MLLARKCIEEGATVEKVEANVAYSHRLLAAILASRNVNDQALSHARQAVALEPHDAFAFDTMSRALEALGRFDEALAASKSALAESDGQYPSMQFQLGSVYFALEQWELARKAYESVAGTEKQNFSAAYNVAICYYNQKYYRDATTWLDEVLRRNPDAATRKKAVDLLARLR